MKRFVFLAIATIALLPLCNGALADSDEPPLFVSNSGNDIGNCQIESRPCRSISYALGQVGKNGQIRVGDGSFELTDIADVIYMLSGAIDVRGGYDGALKPTLIGVPSEFAAKLEDKGFHVVVDAKGLHHAAIASQLSVQASAVATSCVGGFAGSFPCNNVDLLAHISDRTPAARGADIWGFMDLNTNREYAIVGYSIGTAVFDVSDAENPREIGFINGQSTTWRDIKVHQFWNETDARFNAYAYITADNAAGGLFIIDLSDLPHRVARISYASDFSAAHNVYIVDVDFSTGLSITGDSPTLILAGSNIGDGRFRAYSLADPANPTFIATPATPANQPGGNRLYMHDAASMVVTDSRKDTQCVNAGGSDHCDILFDFNESSVDIWDITNPANPARLSQLPYSNSGYTNSGWASEDQQFLYIQDELDERDRGLVTTLRSVSIADLTAPTLVGSWTGPTRAIDHNGFVRGNRYYMSNYSRGLSILDISNGSSPTLSGRFDTYPSSDNVGFPGNWGTYPFFPSGNIALSDIDSGFYMVQDNTLDVAQGTLAFTAPSFGADETQSLNLTISRSGGSQGAVSARWELIGATADAGDVMLSSGAVNWADGDNANRTVTIGLDNDGVVEGLERLLVKLIAPTGGATLSAPALASAYISDPGDTAMAGFTTSGLSVIERGAGIAIATISRSGAATGALSVDFNIVAGDATNGSDFNGATSGTVNWGAGDADPKTIEYTINDDGTVEPDEFFEIELSNAVGGAVGSVSTLRVDILDGSGPNNAPNAIAGPGFTVRTGDSVTLNGNASNDPDGDVLTYAWSQIEGPSVTLNNANAAIASFTAPSVSSDTLLRFLLQVTDARGLSDTSTANITVTSGSTAAIGSSGGGGLGLLTILALFGLLALSRKDAV